MTRLARRSALVVAALGCGLFVGLELAGSAAAFPRHCAGFHCVGSKTDDFGPVCHAGASTYWEDSNLPANAVDPHVTSFTISPEKPCSGATVSAPTPDPWPASAKDPDGRAARPNAGEATFRVRWTVTVPKDSHFIAPMKVSWTIAWTTGTGGGSTTTEPTTTTPKSPYGKAASHVQDSIAQELRAQKALEEYLNDPENTLAIGDDAEPGLSVGASDLGAAASALAGSKPVGTALSDIDSAETLDKSAHQDILDDTQFSHNGMVVDRGPSEEVAKRALHLLQSAMKLKQRALRALDAAEAATPD